MMALMEYLIVIRNVFYKYDYFILFTCLSFYILQSIGFSSDKQIHNLPFCLLLIFGTINRVSMLCCCLCTTFMLLAVEDVHQLSKLVVHRQMSIVSHFENEILISISFALPSLFAYTELHDPQPSQLATLVERF